jgi:hypothetical protein
MKGENVRSASYSENRWSIFFILPWRNGKYIPDSILKTEEVCSWLCPEDRGSIFLTTLKTGTIFLILSLKTEAVYSWFYIEDRFSLFLTVLWRQALCLQLHSEDRGSTFLILFLCVTLHTKQYLPDSALKTQAVCFLFYRWYVPGCMLKTKSIFSLLYPKKRGIIFLIKVATSYQITRHQNPEDRKYDTGEHPKKGLRVGL